MASHESALKKQRQDERRRIRNRQHLSRLRTQVKKIRRALASRDAKEAASLLPATLSLIDHSARVGVIHRNTAARTKSRIVRAVGKLAAPA